MDKDDKMALTDMMVNISNEEKGTQIMRSVEEHWEKQGEPLGIIKAIRIAEVRAKVEMVKKMHSKGIDVQEISHLIDISKSDVRALLNLRLKN